MLDLIPHPSQITATSLSQPSVQPSTFRSRLADLLRAPRDRRALAELTTLLAHAVEVEQVRMALARLAVDLAGADRAELYAGRSGQPSHRVASWPTQPPPARSGHVDGSLRGPIGHLAARSQRENPRGSSLTIPLRSLGAEFGHLKLTWKRRKTLSSGLFRVLEQLCAIAAAAERGFAGQAIGFEPASPRESVSLLDGVLAYSLAQAQRRNEPVSLVFVAVDRLTAIRDLLGESLAEAAVERVERAIRATVRVSDVVARVDSGRVAVLLPNASAENALRVAETIRSAVARVGEPSTTMPILTASLGVATYPDQAGDVTSLRASAASALLRARTFGPDRVEQASVLGAGRGQRVG